MNKKIFPLIIATWMLAGCGHGDPRLSQSKSAATEKKEAIVYGPPQVIYRIDNDRFFTLEEYTRCENGKTFYNNKAKGIHTEISPSSGYLFKGRLFWLSTRDDRLAFPFTLNNNKSVCLGSNNGCMRAIMVTADGGEKVRSAFYGEITFDPNGDTKDYDMLVTNESIYMIEYRTSGRTNPVVDRWDFDETSPFAVVRSDDRYEFFRPGEEKPYYGFYKFDLSRFYPKNGVVEMQCDRSLEPARRSL